MSNKFKMQVPADVHNLSVLLARLGIKTGPMKAAKIDQDSQVWVNIWFVPVSSATPIKRVRARLLHCYSLDMSAHHRRVYLDIKVQTDDGEWFEVTDALFIHRGLETPMQYGGMDLSSRDHG